jgi:hypothetical protein
VVSGRVGIRAEPQTEESAIAFFAAERPDENHRQDSFFQKSLAPGLMNSCAIAIRTANHPASPDAVA